MGEIHKPMRVPELNLQPTITGRVRLSEDMQQTFALLAAYCENQRVIIKASETGYLQTAGPLIKDIIVIKNVAEPYAWEGSNVSCTVVAVIAGLDNTGKVWVRPYKTADATNAWPLNKGEPFGFSISNLNQLHVTVEKSNELAIVAYTR